MKLNFWPFKKARRQAKYCLNVRRDIPLEDLIRILQYRTPLLSAREWGKLPKELQQYFIRANQKPSL